MVKKQAAMTEINSGENGANAIDPNEFSDEDNDQEVANNGRSLRKKRKANNRPFYLDSDVVAPKKMKPREKHPEVQFETSWICAECREAECMMNMDADELVICDGKCQRLFHYPCAGLEKLPAADEDFVCTDCVNKRHSCAICQHYGQDDEDVFKCNRDNCGLFFHQSCLEMQNVEMKMVEIVESKRENDSDSETKEDNISNAIMRPSFVCPAHYCWACTQIDLKEEDEKRKKQEAADKAKTKKSGSRPKSKKVGGAFESKRERRLIRCLECPIAYHVSCIPPAAKFHELAILCHEHAATCNLPVLDPEASIQSIIEKEIDEKFESYSEQKKRAHAKRKAICKNLFFPGISGRNSTRGEKELLNSLHDKLDDFSDDNLFFCLPCEFKDEVFLKPPAYRHIQTNQIDPQHKPPKILTSGEEVCQCVGFCGDDCLNRMLYVECFGDASGVAKKSGHKQYNCNVGPECGNRRFAKKKYPRCKPKREEGKGWGLTVCENVKRGDLIQEYVGEVIDHASKEQRLIEWSKEHPNDPNFYIMALQPGWFIDARKMANMSRFINHSCEPNCVILPINVMGRIRCGVIALRDIVAGEFLSYDYHFDTRHGDKFSCRCGSLKCRGTMKGGVKASPTSLGAVKKSKKEMLESATVSYERDKKFLSEYNEDARRRGNLVAETVPGAKNQDELVANGPQKKDRKTALNNRLFLWRNVQSGANFDTRFKRLELKKYP